MIEVLWTELLFVIMAKRLFFDSDGGKSKHESNENKKLISGEMRAHLAAIGQTSKSGLARVLHVMQEQGIVQHEGSDDHRTGKSLRTERRKITHAVNRIAEIDTPYGRIIQSMDIGLEKSWEFIHPFKLMYYLTTVSESFASMFHDAVTRAHGKLRLIVYGDEFTPGNPNRIDGGRSLMAFYYTFVDFPTWIVNRHQGWFLYLIPS